MTLRDRKVDLTTAELAMPEVRKIEQILATELFYRHYTPSTDLPESRFIY